MNQDTWQHGLGRFNLDVLKKVEEVFFELGLTEARIDVASSFTNELVEQL